MYIIIIQNFFFVMIKQNDFLKHIIFYQIVSILSINVFVHLFTFIYLYIYIFIFIYSFIYVFIYVFIYLIN